MQAFTSRLPAGAAAGGCPPPLRKTLSLIRLKYAVSDLWVGRSLLTGFGVRFVRGPRIRFLMVVPLLMMRVGRQQATHWKRVCMSCHRALAPMTSGFLPEPRPYADVAVCENAGWDRSAPGTDSQARLLDSAFAMQVLSPALVCIGSFKLRLVTQREATQILPKPQQTCRPGPRACGGEGGGDDDGGLCGASSLGPQCRT